MTFSTSAFDTGEFVTDTGLVIVVFLEVDKGYVSTAQKNFAVEAISASIIAIISKKPNLD
jgi:hypothetical protein